MAKTTVQIPGEILKTTIIGGMTFDELLVLGAIPFVFVLPSLFIDAIPLSVTIAFVGIGAIGVMIVVFKTPDGQSPVKWFPRYVDRVIKPNKYKLKPKSMTRHGDISTQHVNVIHTAPLVREESLQEEHSLEEFAAKVEYGEKLLEEMMGPEEQPDGEDAIDATETTTESADT